MNEVRLIDANALKERAKTMLKIIGEDNLSDYEQGKKYAFETVIDFIDNAPSVDPTIVLYEKRLKKARHGKYVIYDVDFLLDNLAREVNIMESARQWKAGKGNDND